MWQPPIFVQLVVGLKRVCPTGFMEEAQEPTPSTYKTIKLDLKKKAPEICRYTYPRYKALHLDFCLSMLTYNI